MTLLLVAQLAIAFAVAGAIVLNDATIGREITIEGRLELDGHNYFLEPRFVIAGDDGSRVPVTTWAPLEVPPSPPATSPLPPALPRTMQEFLGRRLSVTGVHRVVPASGDRPSIPRLAAGDPYLEVVSVADAETGETLFKAERSTQTPPKEIATTAGDAAPARTPAASLPSAAGEAGPVATPTAPAPSAPEQAPSAHAVAPSTNESDPTPARTPAAPATEEEPPPASQEVEP